MSERKVIIRGHVFNYEEKAPFVASGESVLGALEYDPEADQTRCHECGAWATGLAHHVRVSHSMNRAEYNSRHGLNKSSALSGLKTRENHRLASISRDDIGKATGAAAMAAARTRTNKGNNRPAGPQFEARNENARCKAQILFRLMTLAAQVGHTPTVSERIAAGLPDGMINRRFGNISNALRASELEPNRGPRITPLHLEYPKTEEEIRGRIRRWEDPMPWPEEYFSGVTRDVALRRMD